MHSLCFFSLHTQLTLTAHLILAGVHLSISQNSTLSFDVAGSDDEVALTPRPYVRVTNPSRLDKDRRPSDRAYVCVCWIIRATDRSLPD